VRIITGLPNAQARPAASARGETREQAIANIKEAIYEYVTALEENGFGYLC
jgi:predicted RNase H-like HicB family nuclease